MPCPQHVSCAAAEGLGSVSESVAGALLRVGMPDRPTKCGLQVDALALELARCDGTAAAVARATLPALTQVHTSKQHLVVDYCETASTSTNQHCMVFGVLDRSAITKLLAAGGGAAGGCAAYREGVKAAWRRRAAAAPVCQPCTSSMHSPREPRLC